MAQAKGDVEKTWQIAASLGTTCSVSGTPDNSGAAKPQEHGDEAGDQIDEAAGEGSRLRDAFAPRAEEARDQLDRDDRPAHGDGELFANREPVLLGSEQLQFFQRDPGKAHPAEPDRSDDAEHEQAAKDGDAPHDVGDGIGQQTADDRVGRDQAGGKGEAKPQ